MQGSGTRELRIVVQRAARTQEEAWPDRGMCFVGGERQCFQKKTILHGKDRRVREKGCKSWDEDGKRETSSCGGSTSASGRCVVGMRGCRGGWRTRCKDEPVKNEERQREGAGAEDITICGSRCVRTRCDESFVSDKPTESIIILLPGF